MYTTKAVLVLALLSDIISVTSNSKGKLLRKKNRASSVLPMVSVDNWAFSLLHRPGREVT